MWNLKLLNKDTHELLVTLLKLTIKKIFDLTKTISCFSSNEIMYSF